MKKITSIIFLASLLTACSEPVPGPDKGIGGALVGAAWGAGAGAVVGHQLSYAGEGVAVGAGFGAVSGAMIGAGYDTIESTQIKQLRELESLRAQNKLNQAELENLQARLDYSAVGITPALYDIYFDTDATNLRTGAIAQVESIADSIKRNPYARNIIVTGHTDDSGNPEYNQRLAESRARNVVAYLAARGLALDTIKIETHGATRPVASNSTPEGRQLNRRVEIQVK